jgi:hypothetical protein
MWCTKCMSSVCSCNDRPFSTKPFNTFREPKQFNTFIEPRPLPMPQPMFKPLLMPKPEYLLMPTPPGFIKF